jgi:hypothetical protein
MRAAHWIPESEGRRPEGERRGTLKGPLITEVGETFYLMALMAAMLCFYIGMGLLAVRLLG